MDIQRANTILVAKKLIEKGLFVVPVKEKAQYWDWEEKDGKLKYFPFEKLKNELWHHDRGIALVLLDGLEAIDIENVGLFIFEQMKQKYPDLWKKLVITETGGGGRHLIYKSEIVEGGKKLARKTNQLLVETRGHRNYIVIPCSPKYKLVQGDLADIQMISKEEREILLNFCKSFNEVEEVKRSKNSQCDLENPNLPSNIYASKVEWADLLETFGWTRCWNKGETDYWYRPDKHQGTHSASTGHCGDLLYNFSSSVQQLEENKAYSKAGFLCAFKFDNDWEECLTWIKENYCEFDANLYAQEETLHKVMEKIEKKTFKFDKNDQMIAYLWQGEHAKIDEKDRFARADQILKLVEKIPNGIIKEYIRCYLPTTSANPKFHLSTILSILSHTVGRNIWNSENIYPNLWCANIGLIGSGKSSNSKHCEDFIDPADIIGNSTWSALMEDSAIKLEESAIAGAFIKSEEQILQECYESDKQPKKLFYKLDELSAIFGKFKQEPGYEEFMCSVYDNPRYLTKKTKTSGKYIVWKPTVTMLGCTAAAWFTQNCTAQSWGGGFLSRILFFVGGSDYRLPFTDPKNEDAFQKIKEQLAKIKELKGEIKYSEGAKEKYCEWYKKFKVEGMVSAFQARLESSAKKIAILFAASELSTTISEKNMVDACDLVSDIAKQFDDFAEKQIHFDKDTEKDMKHLNSIRKHPEGSTLAQIQKRMKKDSLRGSKFKELIAHLLQTNQIEWECPTPEKCGGRCDDVSVNHRIYRPVEN